MLEDTDFTHANRSQPPPLQQTHRNNHDFLALRDFLSGNLAFLDVLEYQVGVLRHADVRGEFEALQRDVLSALARLRAIEMDTWNKILSRRQVAEAAEAPIYCSGTSPLHDCIASVHVSDTYAW